MSGRDSRESSLNKTKPMQLTVPNDNSSRAGIITCTVHVIERFVCVDFEDEWLANPCAVSLGDTRAHLLESR